MSSWCSHILCLDKLKLTCIYLCSILPNSFIALMFFIIIWDFSVIISLNIFFCLFFLLFYLLISLLGGILYVSGALFIFFFLHSLCLKLDDLSWFLLPGSDLLYEPLYWSYCPLNSRISLCFLFIIFYLYWYPLLGETYFSYFNPLRHAFSTPFLVFAILTTFYFINTRYR